MRRGIKGKRRGDTKVWHDPHMTEAGRRQQEAREKRNAAETTRRREKPAKRTRARIIAGPNGDADPREQERERLLERVLLAEGRPSISKAADRYLEAGFEFPRVQDVWLQLLEHSDEGRIAEAIEQLAAILEADPPERRKVLESRLRRIEEFAEEPPVQSAAADLRRVLCTKYSETLNSETLDRS